MKKVFLALVALGLLAGTAYAADRPATRAVPTNALYYFGNVRAVSAPYVVVYRRRFYVPPVVLYRVQVRATSMGVYRLHYRTPVRSAMFGRYRWGPAF